MALLLQAAQPSGATAAAPSPSDIATRFEPEDGGCLLVRDRRTKRIGDICLVLKPQVRALSCHAAAASADMICTYVLAYADERYAIGRSEQRTDLFSPGPSGNPKWLLTRELAPPHPLMNMPTSARKQ